MAWRRRCAGRHVGGRRLCGGGGASNNGNGAYAAGGFGAGGGTSTAGGAGLGAGGAIFVQQGGTLIFAGSGSEQNDGVSGGAALGIGTSNNGSAYGSGIFLQGDQTITFAPDSGHSITLSGAIADMTGSHDHTGQTGTGRLLLDGDGTLVLGAANTFTGGVTTRTARWISPPTAPPDPALSCSRLPIMPPLDQRRHRAGQRDRQFRHPRPDRHRRLPRHQRSYGNGVLVLNGDAGSDQPRRFRPQPA